MNSASSMKEKNNMHYLSLVIMMVLSFLTMYILMYSMVNRFEDIFPNVNQFYMAALMTAPMIIMEVIFMNMMFPKMKLNILIVVLGFITMFGTFLLIRNQSNVGDVQLVKSMIPHHSGAVLMCQKAKLTDPELKELCNKIISSQELEINQMKLILLRLK